MWFFENPKVGVDDTFEASGDESSDCSAAPPPPPPPTKKATKASGTGSSSVSVFAESVCGDVVELIQDAVETTIGSHPGESKVLVKSPSISSENSRTVDGTVASAEEENGAIEVTAVGRGFQGAVEDWKDVVTVLSSSSSTGSNSSHGDATKQKHHRKRSRFLFGLFVVLVLSLSVALVIALYMKGDTFGIRKDSSSAAVAGAAKEEMGEQIGAEVVDVVVETPTVAPTSSEPQGEQGAANNPWNDESENRETWSPTWSPTPATTVEVTSHGTVEWICDDDHNIVVTTSCQGTVPLVAISYCFSWTRDGDWYWIRDNGDYDEWGYTEGAADGTMEFSDMPQATYLVSLVRDSMEPYDVLITESFTVPDCSVTT
mmetsp:Transcript_31138/g.51905  ORF Transcript_31138/g.51905 Transcript_31138/m.51905 type:complete len:373 (+) Transcript_31138:28-1146(+)